MKSDIKVFYDCLNYVRILSQVKIKTKIFSIPMTNLTNVLNVVYTMVFVLIQIYTSDVQ